mmetsp:Transcript_138914/g.443179  ORF Transcript_138914/g.443179 Transcript_138914/m.443179 type:complete len:117 (+) Transcript_138914:243-593(+)
MRAFLGESLCRAAALERATTGEDAVAAATSVAVAWHGTRSVATDYPPAPDATIWLRKAGKPSATDQTSRFRTDGARRGRAAAAAPAALLGGSAEPGLLEQPQDWRISWEKFRALCI